MSVGFSLRKKTAELFMHYNYTNHEKELCIICFEDSSKKYNYEIWWNYYKNCECKFLIHQDCFNQWYKTNPTCPICRKTILSKDIETIYKKNINKCCDFVMLSCGVMIIAFLWLQFISSLIEVVFIY